MTNIEYFRTASKAELSEYLCAIMYPDCANCLATEHCYNGHNGMPEWLEDEHE